METIVVPVSIDKSPEARGRSGLLTYEHMKIDILAKEATFIYEASTNEFLFFTMKTIYFDKFTS